MHFNFISAKTMKKNWPFFGCGSSPSVGVVVIWATFTLLSRRVTSQSVDSALSCRRMCCIDCFCCGPGTTWSLDSELCVQDPSSLSGDDDESCGEADPSVCYDSPSCICGECCEPGTVMDQDPDDSHGGHCQYFGQIPGPTLPPTIASSTSPPTFGAGSVQLIITSSTSPPTLVQVL